MLKLTGQISVNGTLVEYEYSHYEDITEIPVAEILRIVNLHLKGQAKLNAYTKFLGRK